METEFIDLDIIGDDVVNNKIMNLDITGADVVKNNKEKLSMGETKFTIDRACNKTGMQTQKLDWTS